MTITHNGHIYNYAGLRCALDTWYRKWSVLAFEHWLERRTDHDV